MRCLPDWGPLEVRLWYQGSLPSRSWPPFEQHHVGYGAKINEGGYNDNGDVNDYQKDGDDGENEGDR